MELIVILLCVFLCGLLCAGMAAMFYVTRRDILRRLDAMDAAQRERAHERDEPAQPAQILREWFYGASKGEGDE